MFPSHNDPIAQLQEEARVAPLQARYQAAMRVIEAGIAIQKQAGSAMFRPEKMRVELTAGVLNSSTLINLLIAKGLITMGELFAVMAGEAEGEAMRYIELANQAYAHSFRMAQERGDIPPDAECPRVTIFIDPDGGSGLVTEDEAARMTAEMGMEVGDAHGSPRIPYDAPTSPQPT